MLHFKDQLSTEVYIIAQYLTISNSVIMVQFYRIKAKHGNYYQFLVLVSEVKRLT